MVGAASISVVLDKKRRHASEAPPQAPMGELTALPHTPAPSWAGGGGGGGGGTLPGAAPPSPTQKYIVHTIYCNILSTIYCIVVVNNTNILYCSS